MKTFSFTELDINEANAIVTIIGDLPTKSNAYGLFMKLRQQLEQQAAQPQAPLENKRIPD